MRWIATLLMLMLSSFSVSAMPFSWSRVESMQEEITSVHSDYMDGTVFFVVSKSGVIFRTTDSGVSWNPLSIPSGKPVRNLWIDMSVNRAWYASADAGELHELWYSRDNGDTWEFRSESETKIFYLSPSPLASGVLVAAYQMTGSNRLQLKKSDNGGIDWRDVLDVEDQGIAPVWHTSSVWQIHWGTFASYDYGETWRNVSNKTVSNCGYDIPPSLLASTSDGLFRSRDNLLTWLPLWKKPLNFVVVNPRNSNQLLCGKYNLDPESSIYYSGDTGESFTEWNNGLSAGISQICFGADWLFLAVSGDHLYRYDESPGDIDLSGRIDGADLIILATAFGSRTGESAFVSRADLNNDNVIDGSDLVILSAVFGHRFYYDESKTPGDFPDIKP